MYVYYLHLPKEILYYDVACFVYFKPIFTIIFFFLYVCSGYFENIIIIFFIEKVIQNELALCYLT